jgi:hypothetical protein
MITFHPSISFQQSAEWLDNKRLGKQRVECLQILRALTDPNYGWQHHPTVKMWKGYEKALILYGLEICDEWKSRGYKDSCLEKIVVFGQRYSIPELFTAKYPSWLTEEFASSHRAILLAKDYEWYSKLGWQEQPAEKVNGKWPYLWTVVK